MSLRISKPPESGSVGSVFVHIARWIASWAVTLSHARALYFVDFHDVKRPNLLVKAFYYVTSFGYQSVMVFFVLSGFLVGSSVVRSVEADKWSWSKYLNTRLSRLYAALVPAMALGICLDLAGSHLFAASGVYAQGLGGGVQGGVLDRVGPGVVLANLAFLQTIFVWSPYLGSNGALWSLTNEFWYYILFPAMFLVWRSSLKVVAKLGLIAGCASIFWLLGLDRSLHYLIWLVGAAICFIPTEFMKGWLKWPGALLFAASLVWSRYLEATPTGRDHNIDYLIGFGFTVFLLGFLGNAKPAKQPGGHVSEVLAGASYTLYLVHLPVLVFMAAAITHGQRFQPTLPKIALFTGVLVALAVVVAAMWWIGERNTGAIRAYIDGLLNKPKNALT